jgi:hypothetical protein
MSQKTREIVQLFNDLDDSEKVGLLKILKFHNDPSEVIKRFSERHQSVHKSSIGFKSSVLNTNGVVTVTVTMTTAFGKFTGVGRNSAEGKFHAIKNAQAVEYLSLSENEDEGNQEVPDLAPMAKAETYDPFGVMKTLANHYEEEEGTYSEELSY